LLWPWEVWKGCSASGWTKEGKGGELAELLAGEVMDEVEVEVEVDVSAKVEKFGVKAEAE
jgi:hypothetical protein